MQLHMTFSSSKNAKIKNIQMDGGGELKAHSRTAQARSADHCQEHLLRENNKSIPHQYRVHVRDQVLGKKG
jgi:hypothetical protein